MRLLARERATAKASFIINAVMFGGILLVGAVGAPLMGPIEWQKLGPNLCWLAGGGVAFALTGACAYKVMAYLDAATSSILNTLNAVFTVILAGLVLHEDLTLMQAAGALVMLGAIYYVLMLNRHKVAAPHHNHRRRLSKAWLWGVVYSVLGALFYAIAIVNEKHLLGLMSVPTYMVIGWGFQALMVWLVALMVQPAKLSLLANGRTLGWAGGAGILRGLAGLLFVVCQVKSDNVALMTVISNLRLLVIVWLAAWFLREREKLLQKFLAACITLLGLAIIFWH